jgi:hypothetical protein
MVVDATAKDAARRIQEIAELEGEIRRIIESARQAYALRNTEPATG